MTALQTTTFAQHVKTLLQLDKEIHTLQDQLRDLRQQKQKTEEDIMATMVERKWKTIDVGNKCILTMAEKKHYSSLSYTYLEKTLSQIIPDKAQIDYVIKYLKDHRETKMRQEIVLANKEKD